MNWKAFWKALGIVVGLAVGFIAAMLAAAWWAAWCLSTFPAYHGLIGVLVGASPCAAIWLTFGVRMFYRQFNDKEHSNG